VRLIQTSVDEEATRLIGTISPACDRYVQYLLPGTNPSVLNRHRWGLPHRNLIIATSLSPPFPSKCSIDPPKWPCPVSDYPQPYYPKLGVFKHLLPTCGLSTTWLLPTTIVAAHDLLPRLGPRPEIGPWSRGAHALDGSTGVVTTRPGRAVVRSSPTHGWSWWTAAQEGPPV
jgi:hypothetical protein